MRVVVTGANGFVGRDLVATLAARPSGTVYAASRNPATFDAHAQIIPRLMPDLRGRDAADAFAALFEGADTVIHLAAMTPTAPNQEADLHSVNVAGVTELADAARSHGIARFVLVSSIRVAGAVTGEAPITETSPLVLDDAYASSKAAAEQALIACARGSQMAWTIVRPPLIYGPGVKGPMRSLANAVLKGAPLPFGLVTKNSRDMIGVRNLSEFLALTATHPAAKNETFVVRDGAPLSTRALIETIASAANVKARLVSVPPALLKAAGRLTGKGESLARLIGDYRIDDSKARALLGWHPPHAPAFDMERMTASILDATQVS